VTGWARRLIMTLHIKLMYFINMTCLKTTRWKYYIFTKKIIIKRCYSAKFFNLMCKFFKKSPILLDDIVVRSCNPRSPCKVNEHRVLQNFPPILYGPECHPVRPPNVESPLNHGPFAHNDWTSQPSHTISFPK
jgi:hypothetical protein